MLRSSAGVAVILLALSASSLAQNPTRPRVVGNTKGSVELSVDRWSNLVLTYLQEA